MSLTFSMLSDLGMYPIRYVVGNTATAGSFLSMVKYKNLCLTNVDELLSFEV